MGKKRQKLRVKDLRNWAIHRDACPDAVDWLAKVDGEESFYFAWRTCPSGDWLLWALGTSQERHHLNRSGNARDMVSEKTISAVLDMIETCLPEKDVEYSEYVREAMRQIRAWLARDRKWTDRRIINMLDTIEEGLHVKPGEWEKIAVLVYNLMLTITYGWVDNPAEVAYGIINGWMWDMNGKEAAKIVRKHVPWKGAKEVLEYAVGKRAKELKELAEYEASEG